jgi:hypothetical protein
MASVELLAQNRKLYNPWTSDFLTTKSEELRNPHFRQGFVKKYGSACMVTGAQSTSEAVPVGHLLPLKTKKDIIRRVGIQDVNMFRNAATLARNIEVGYDQLKLSFMPNALGQLCMKIWDPTIAASPIFSGSADLIGQFEHLPLKHPQPFKRVLSYQAHFAYHHALENGWLTDSLEDEPREFGSPEDSSFQLLRMRRIATERMLEETKSEAEEPTADDDSLFLVALNSLALPSRESSPSVSGELNDALELVRADLEMLEANPSHQQVVALCAQYSVQYPARGSKRDMIPPLRDRLLAMLE